jgi:hypothetical protein
MNNFINNVIRRHLQPENNIVPRVPGRFESFNVNTQELNEPNFMQSESFKIDPNTEIKNSNESTYERPVINGRKNSLDFNTTVTPGKKNDEEVPFGIKTHYNENSTTDNTRNKDSKVSPDYPEQIIITHAEKSNLTTTMNSDVFTQNNTVPFFKKENSNKEKVKRPEPLLIPQKTPDITINKQLGLFENTEQRIQNIKVSIGRIEVRAIVSSLPEKKNAGISQKPNMTLDEYLKTRNGK